jgi:hypothetical protein
LFSVLFHCRAYGIISQIIMGTGIFMLLYANIRIPAFFRKKP